MDWGLIVENAARTAIGPEAIYIAIAAIGLNVHFGYTGLANFGQVAFVACGAYGVAIAVESWGWSYWAGIAVGIGAAIVLAVLVGIQTVRLRSDYLAIATIALGEIIRYVMRSPEYEPTTGGSSGLQNFANSFYDLNPLEPGRYGFGIFRFTHNRMWLILVGWALVTVCCLIVFLLMRSPWGRVLKAIREDEDAVRSLGKNVYAYKMQSLVLGGVFGALAGAVFATANQSVQPDNYSTAFTFTCYTVMILGGAARVMGPVVGSMIFWALIQFTDVALRQAVKAGYIDQFLSGTQVGIVRQMLIGLGLIALVIFRPQGIFGDKREVAVSARR